MYAADLQGQVRLVAQMPGELELDDISGDGRALLAHHTLIGTMRAVGPGEAAERDLTWLDSSIPADLSPDGKTILFNELGEGGGKTSSVYLRGLDGSPPVRLGDGTAHSLSPDGKSVLVSLPDVVDRFVLLPTGAGEPRSIPLPGFDALDAAAWLPDGREFIFEGRESGKWRIYRMSAEGGKPRAISPEGIRIPAWMTGPVTPDGRFFFGARGPAQWFRFPIDGGEPLPITGLAPGEFPIRWASDRSLWVNRAGGRGIFRIDLPTRRKMTPLRNELDVQPGTVAFFRVVITADGRAFAYGARQTHSVLYVVEGLR